MRALRETRNARLIELGYLVGPELAGKFRWVRSSRASSAGCGARGQVPLGAELARGEKDHKHSDSEGAAWDRAYDHHWTPGYDIDPYHMR